MGSNTAIIDDLKRLPSTEKLRIIDELWESIPAEDVPSDEALLDEMDRRFGDYLLNPDRATHWPDLRRAISSELGLEK